MNCENCKYSSGNICVIPLYVNGERYNGRIITEPEKGCELFDALVTMETERK